jgi:glycosyltransferase involved in cell wall biosynthesis
LKFIKKLQCRQSMIFSIITVTRNSARYLEECISSVLSQDCTDLEHIIVDCVSVDGTLDIVREYAGRDFRLRWISERDEGISDAFNKGLAMARGELIGFLNSDDAYAPGALRTVAEAFRGNPETDVFHGDLVRFSGNSPLFTVTAGRVDDGIWHEMPLNHPATFVTSRAFAVVGGFDTSLRLAMDYELVLRLYLAGLRFLHIPAVLARMRYGGASDERFVAARREVVAATVAKGYPPHKAWWWFAVAVGKGYVKNLLRRSGMNCLIRLHSRFKSCGGEDDGT